MGGCTKYRDCKACSKKYSQHRKLHQTRKNVLREGGQRVGGRLDIEREVPDRRYQGRTND